MKKRRIMACLLSATLLLTMFAACAQQPAATQPAAPSSSQPAAPDDKQPEPEKKWEPNRPINIVVPYAAGGAIDRVCRAIQPQLSENLGVPVTVTNMPEGSTVVAYEHVASSDKNGYTIMALSPEVGLNAVMGSSELIPDDFTAIGFLAAFANTIVVHKDSPYQTITDLTDALKTKEMTAGCAANGCAWTQAFMILSKLTDSKLPKFIPQGGGFPAAQAAMRKEVDFTTCGLAEVLDLLGGGDIRVLGYFGKEPYEVDNYGTVPPFSDAIPEAAKYAPFGGWTGLAVAKGTDESIVKRLVEAYEYAVDTEEFQKFLEENCFIGEKLSGEAFQENVDLRAYTSSSLLWENGISKKSPADVGIKEP